MAFQFWNQKLLLGPGGKLAYDSRCCCVAGVVCIYCINNIMPPKVQVSFSGIIENIENCGECANFNNITFELDAVGESEQACWYNFSIPAFTPPYDALCNFTDIRFFWHAQVTVAAGVWGTLAQMYRSIGGDTLNFYDIIPTNDYPIDCTQTRVLTLTAEDVDPTCSAGPNASATVVPLWV